MKHPLQIIFLALVLAALGQAGWQHARLPARVAIHFNAAGRANAWASRTTETALHLGTVLFLAALIEGITFAQVRLPANSLPLPNHAYWFAPERAATPRAWLVGAGLPIGCALLAFFLALFPLVLFSQANGSAWH